jgi:hypothetical protein
MSVPGWSSPPCTQPRAHRPRARWWGSSGDGGARRARSGRRRAGGGIARCRVRLWPGHPPRVDSLVQADRSMPIATPWHHAVLTEWSRQGSRARPVSLPVRTPDSTQACMVGPSRRWCWCRRPGSGSRPAARTDIPVYRRRSARGPDADPRATRRPRHQLHSRADELIRWGPTFPVRSAEDEL